MIDPEYTQIQRNLVFSEDLWDRWYCVCFENVENRRFARYMSPTGWRKTCHYFADKRDAELAFGKHGWKSLPVTPQEISDQIYMERDCRETMEQDFRISERDDIFRGYDDYDRLDFLG